MEPMTKVLIGRLKEQLRNEIGNDSDYLLAEVLGVERQTIAKWHKGQVPQTHLAVKIAHRLNEPELKIIAMLEIERAKDEERKSLWKTVLKNTVGERRRGNSPDHYTPQNCTERRRQFA